MPVAEVEAATVQRDLERGCTEEAEDLEQPLRITTQNTI
jgi:hypothetical protein